MEKINDKQLSVLVFMCAAVQLVSNERLYTQSPAQDTLTALLLKYGVLLILLAMLRHMPPFAPTRGSAWLAACVFSFACVNEAACTVRFYNEVSETPLYTPLLLAIIFAAAICAGLSGAGTVVRLAQTAALLFVLSAVLLCASNIKNASLANMSVHTPLAETAFANICYIPGEALLLLAFCGGRQRLKSGAKIMLALFMLCFAVLASLQLVFGTAGTLHSPLQMLTHIGSISVFRRLDFIYVFVWLFALLAKISCFLSAAQSAAAVYKHGVPMLFVLTAAFLPVVFYIDGACARLIITLGIVAYVPLCAVLERGRSHAR